MFGPGRSGTGDVVAVGISTLGSNEAAGAALGDSVTFGQASTAILFVGTGAEAGSTAGTKSIGLTKVLNAADGMKIDFQAITTSSNIFDAVVLLGATNYHERRECRSRSVGRPGRSFL